MNNEPIDIVQYLIESAKAYSELLSSEIILESDEFVNQKIYRMHFFRSNFLHLTGVVTALSANDFFDKCLLGTITLKDFNFRDRKDKTTIKRKLKHLININKFFLNKIMVQESFTKNGIECKIGTSDDKCTIGFINNRFYFVPKTILANNHLDIDKKIIIVKPIIK